MRSFARVTITRKYWCGRADTKAEWFSLAKFPKLGALETMADMLQFAARNRIASHNERFSMREANAAIAHLASGKARYRTARPIPRDNGLAAYAETLCG